MESDPIRVLRPPHTLFLAFFLLSWRHSDARHFYNLFQLALFSSYAVVDLNVFRGLPCPFSFGEIVHCIILGTKVDLYSIDVLDLMDEEASIVRPSRVYLRRSRGDSEAFDTTDSHCFVSNADALLPSAILTSAAESLLRGEGRLPAGWNRCPPSTASMDHPRCRQSASDHTPLVAEPTRYTEDGACRHLGTDSMLRLVFEHDC